MPVKTRSQTINDNNNKFAQIVNKKYQEIRIKQEQEQEQEQEQNELLIPLCWNTKLQKYESQTDINIRIACGEIITENYWNDDLKKFETLYESNNRAVQIQKQKNKEINDIRQLKWNKLTEQRIKSEHHKQQQQINKEDKLNAEAAILSKQVMNDITEYENLNSTYIKQKKILNQQIKILTTKVKKFSKSIGLSIGITELLL